MYKYIIILLAFFVLPLVSNAQSEAKLNIVTTPMGMPSFAMESALTRQSTLQGELVAKIAPKNFMGTGLPSLGSSLLFEYRYYPFNSSNFKFDNLILGVNSGFGYAKENRQLSSFFGTANPMQKDQFALGMSYYLGGTIGYKYFFTPKFGIEASITSGYELAYYDVYTQKDEMTSRTQTGVLEQSFCAYKAGVYLIYRFNVPSRYRLLDKYWSKKSGYQWNWENGKKKNTQKNTRKKKSKKKKSNSKPKATPSSETQEEPQANTVIPVIAPGTEKETETTEEVEQISKPLKDSDK